MQMVLMFSERNNLFRVFVLMSLFLTQCGSNKNTISEHHIASDAQPCLICIHDQDENVALINLHGDTIAPFGKFSFCFFDTTFTFGNVYDADRKGFFAIVDLFYFLRPPEF